MANIPSKDDLLSKIMNKAKLEMPFSDFDETVMHRIRKETFQKQITYRDSKLSFIFFILGIVCGLTVHAFLQNAQYSFLDIPPDTLLLVFQVGFVVIVLVQLETNLQLIGKWKKQPKHNTAT